MVTQSSKPSPADTPELRAPTMRSPSRGRHLRWLGLLLGSGVGGGVTVGWYWLHWQLVPVVTEELSRLLERPVTIGQLENISWRGATFGPSVIAPTATDPDHARIERLTVRFSPWQWLRDRQLALAVTATGAEVYLEQEPDGNWLDPHLTDMMQSPNPGVVMRSLRLVNAQGKLVARAEDGTLKSPVGMQHLSGLGIFQRAEKRTEFKLVGELSRGGEFQVQGSAHVPTHSVKLLIQGNNLAATVLTDLFPLDLEILAGQAGGNLEIELLGDQIQAWRGVATITDLTMVLPNLPQPFTQAHGSLRFRDTEIHLDPVTAHFGPLTGVTTGSLDINGDYQLNVQTQSAPFDNLLAALKLDSLPWAITAEIVSQVQVTGPLLAPRLWIAAETVGASQVDQLTFRHVASQMSLVGQNLTLLHFEATPSFGGQLSGSGRVSLPLLEQGFSSTAQSSPRQPFLLSVQGTDFLPGVIAQAYGQSWVLAEQPISGQTQLQGKIDFEQFKVAEAQGSLRLAVAGGSVVSRDLKITGGSWQGNWQATDLHLKRLLPPTWCETEPVNFLCDRPWGTLGGEVALSGTFQEFWLHLQGSGTGQWLTEAGAIALDEVAVTDGKFRLGLMPSNLTMQQGLEQLTDQPFSEKLAGLIPSAGQLSGQIQVHGPLQNLSFEQLAIVGELTLTDGVPLMSEALQADFAWHQGRLALYRLANEHFQVMGDLTLHKPKAAETQANFTDWIERFDLRVQINALGLDDLDFSQFHQPKLIALQDQVGGTINFSGAFTGTPATPVFAGNLQVREAHLGNITAEPLLIGTLRSQPDQGTKLSLVGRRDQVELTLPAYDQPMAYPWAPTAFSLNLAEISLNGQTPAGSSQLKFTVDHFPVDLLPQVALIFSDQLLPSLQKIPLTGALSGNFAVNWQTQEVRGESVVIAQPSWGHLQGEQLSAQFYYGDHQFTLTQAQLHQGDSTYQLQGSLTATPQGPQLEAKLEIASGKIQSVLTGLQIFELADLQRGLAPPTYGNAASLYDPAKNNSLENSSLETICLATCPLFSIESPDATITGKLEHFAKVRSQLRTLQQQRQAAKVIPELSELAGTFSAEVALSGILGETLAADFQFQGQDWRWDDYQLQQLEVAGRYQGGDLRPLRFRFVNGESQLNFMGHLGHQQQSGQLQLANLPLQLLHKVVDLPSNLELAGQVNGMIELAGSRQNPEMVGVLDIHDGALNQTEIHSSRGEFRYQDARLEFIAQSWLSPDTAPLHLEGSLPYQMPLANVAPDDERLNLTLQVQDDGLGLIEVLTDGALQWLTGQGEVQLDIFGRLDPKTLQPKGLTTVGVVTFQDASLAAQFFPQEPITDVNGKILFDFDRLQFEQLQGNFSGGKMAIAGTLPLTPSTKLASKLNPKQRRHVQPLAITLSGLVLDFPEFYQGGIEGQLDIQGSLSQPEISGELTLADGTILIGDHRNPNAWSQLPTMATIAPQLSNLQLTLGDRIQVLQPLFLNFDVTGTLALNGSLDQPLPSGTLSLERGAVNLFTSQLRLDRGEENLVRFYPERGLDPLLKVNLLASATETSNQPNPILVDPLSPEVSDTSTAQLGSVQTVRIKAQVNGFASQLSEQTIELTSTPPRHTSEIVVLLGGNLADSLAQVQDPIGIANLAGTAVLGTVQEAIRNDIGLSEFRLFPTQIIDETDRISGTTLELGAEAGIDITDNLSLSVIKILTTDKDPQVNVRYRINPNLQIQGATDFSNDNRTSIEFQHRF